MTAGPEDALLPSAIHAEMGWADSENSWSPISSAVLLVASGVYFTSTWILAGLHPLTGLATRFGSPSRRGRADARMGLADK